MWNDRFAGDPCSVWGRAAFKNIFGGGGTTVNIPPAPTPTPPPTMPDPFSPASMEAARNAQAAALQGGRSSTILTTAASRASGTIAGGAYGGAKLGAN